MRRLLLLTLALLPFGVVSAEEMAGAMPPACAAAARSAVPAKQSMEGMAHDAAGHAAMQMHDAMAQAATIPDPDLAFNCGMIAHHQGAIAMAEAELKHGKDAASLTLARTIIAAQQREIAEMTAWIAQHAAAK